MRTKTDHGELLLSGLLQKTGSCPQAGPSHIDHNSKKCPTDLLTNQSDRGSSLTETSSSKIPQLAKQHEPAQLDSEEIHLGNGHLKVPWDFLQRNFSFHHWSRWSQNTLQPLLWLQAALPCRIKSVALVVTIGCQLNCTWN